MELSTLKPLIEKSFYSIKHEGLSIFIKRTIRYITKLDRNPKKNYEASRVCADVLFISGCTLPHPVRYRVTHQREQLNASGINSVEVFYESLTLDMVKNYRVFIFFRCMNTPLIENFVKLAKSNNKKVIFDIDDLIIDEKYTKTIKHLGTMDDYERKAYDRHVNDIQKLLKQCDAAITTTEGMANELKNYVPQVFINRNVASEEMLRLSTHAIYDRDELPFMDYASLENNTHKENYKKAKKESDLRLGKFRIGYFSGSITHNEDFDMIKSAIIRLMDEFSEIELVLIGELTLPEELKAYSSRIITNGFLDWKRLPWLVASVDINLAPLKQSIFNEAKSENKWLEAALVEVTTVASNIGAFAKMMQHNVTGILCENNEDDWYNAIKNLLIDKNLCKEIGKNAYAYALMNCSSIRTSRNISGYLRNIMTPNIAFILPTLQISGGVLVALKHCLTLKNAGFDAYILSDDYVTENPVCDGEELFAISKLDTSMHQSFDVCVATLWSTTNFLLLYPHIKSKLYLVQNFETNFYQYGDFNKMMANATYNYVNKRINYITISKWCKSWLYDDYNKNSDFIPNGLDTKRFFPTKRDFASGKIRILVEGNSNDHYKNVDESFHIINKLDMEKYEVWYMSYFGKPKEWYKYNQFLHKVPYDKVPEVYRQCHILLKSSLLESFSYPPIEMMATGGLVVCRPNEGNKEYLLDNQNCLLYNSVEQAVEQINKLAKSVDLRTVLVQCGLETAKMRSWQNIEPQIIEVYDRYISGS